MTTHPHVRRIVWVIAGLVSATAVLLFGFYLGYMRGIATPERIVVENITNIENKEGVQDFGLFWEVWQRLKEMHIDGSEVTSNDLFYGALKGLAGSFSDPYTTFFPPKEAEKFREDIAGKFGGIGAEIGFDENEILSVIAPLKGTPAERAGLEAGDYILKIDDRDTDGMDVDEAVGFIRGEPGTTVVLNIFRKDWGEPKDISIMREVVKVPTLELSFKENGTIAYLELYSFNENAADDFLTAANSIRTQNAKGLILDLRNNPGGYLEVATYIAGWFVDRGSVLVSERFREGEDRVFRATGNEALKNIPVVILVNGGSASASEILAGILRDLKDAPLVGTETFGKGTVQEVAELSNGSTLKVTVARWVLPDGDILDKKGLEPNFKIEISEEDAKGKRDPQFDKALEVVKQLIATNRIAKRQ